jgi:hypothetical protein
MESFWPSGGFRPKAESPRGILQSLYEFLHAYPRLLQHALERTAIDFPVHWHNAAAIAPAQNHMTAALPFENKSQTLQGASGFLA